MVMRLLDMVGCLSAAMDLVSPEVVGHHRRVAFIAAGLAQTAGLAPSARADLILAGLVHDVGAFSLQDRLLALAFDADDQSHAEVGYRLLAASPRFTRVARLVRLHHKPWKDASGATMGEELANLLSLADRIDTQLPRGAHSPVDRQALTGRIRQGSGKIFNPHWVDAFDALTDSGEFWRGLGDPDTAALSMSLPPEHNPNLGPYDIRNLSRLFSQIIDFRSRFTSTHSMGVAATAVALGRELGMTEEDLAQLEIAGELHDIGKLGVPCEIIMKPAALSTDEMRVMQHHAKHSHSVLGGVPGMERVARWAANHHERLNGKGYPNGSDADTLDLGSRVLAVSDVFTALAEDRPYRKGMDQKQALAIIVDMARRGELDADVASAFIAHQPVVDEVRRQAQDQARQNFERFASPRQTPKR